MSFSANPTESFDVIVVGGGHAGCEAAITAARLGLKTAVFTLNLDRIAWQPCNPAVGGPAKSQLVHDVDALGGGDFQESCHSWAATQAASINGNSKGSSCSSVGLFIHTSAG
ncbi:tRNA uridine 5-carboxymethylaminomethyl modification enzyme MnmG [Cyanobium usitatum str. Tous]|jgi:tRNA U34 5-carboxymethylaminomethyl modifying enzyme MnmG/GidA|nr:tRNA uridine 5-carboxymethylaminomethyl modification enzyme MnmG [Cyanobium usitatum str. Tous]